MLIRAHEKPSKHTSNSYWQLTSVLNWAKIFGSAIQNYLPYGSTMVPLMVPDDANVARSIRRSTVKLPVAPANRPVPPVMVYVSTIETMPGVPVGVPWPEPSPKIMSPLAAIRVADADAVRVGR